jgi:hypothetical protein
LTTSRFSGPKQGKPRPEPDAVGAQCRPAPETEERNVLQVRASLHRRRGRRHLPHRCPDWWVGDIFQTGDGRKLRIVSQIPIEKIEEYRDKPKYAIWEVERA